MQFNNTRIRFVFQTKAFREITNSFSINEFFLHFQYFTLITMLTECHPRSSNSCWSYPLLPPFVHESWFLKNSLQRYPSSLTNIKVCGIVTVVKAQVPVLKCLIMSKVKALREASTRKDYETYNRSAWVQLRTIYCYLVVRISCSGILCHFLLSHDKGRATKKSIERWGGAVPSSS